MNQYLKSAVNRYNQLDKGGKVHLISPISKIDSEIIVEIIELFKKFNAKSIVEILNNYKFRKDDEIKDLLLDANTNFKNKVSEEITDEEDKKGSSILINKRDFVKIKDERILIWVINSWGKDERFCPQKREIIYSIVLNRVEKNLQLTKVPQYANHTFDFEDIDERDEAFDKLDGALLSSGIVNIWEV